MRDKIIFFDADGTLTREPSIWQYMHKHLGTDGDAYKNYLRFESGEISYNEWADADISLWVGRPISELIDIAEQVSYISGIRETVNELKHMGFIIVIISAGLDILANRLRDYIGADMVFANEICVRDGRVAGIGCNRVNSAGDMNKGDIISIVAEKYGIGLDRCIAVGDTRHDKLMFDKVALSILISDDSSFLDKYNMSVDCVICSDTLYNIIDPIKTWTESLQDSVITV